MKIDEKDLKFSITVMSTERRIDGKTLITAICINDNTIVKIEVSYREMLDKTIIRNLFIKDYKSKVCKFDSNLNIGDII